MEYSDIRGINYCCSYGRGLGDLWDHFDADIVGEELGYAAALGFNSVRVWMNYYPFENDPAGMLDNIGRFLDLCGSHGLTCMPIFFDSCGVEPKDYSGEIITRYEAWQRFLADPNFSDEEKQSARKQLEAYAETVGKDTLIPYSEADPSTMLWKWHSPSPGYSLLGDESRWPAWEEYVKAVLTRYGDHPHVLMWDVMNEPNCVRILTPGFDMDRVERFARHFSAIASAHQPRKPITLGMTGNLGFTRQFADCVEILSFHFYEQRYGGDLNKLRQTFDEARALSEELGKPILLTEGLALLFPQDEAGFSEQTQLDIAQTRIPIALEAGIGFYLWQLMDGRFPWSWTGFVHVDGVVKPAGRYLQEVFTTDHP